MLPTVKYVGHRCRSPNSRARLVVPEVLSGARLEGHEVALMITSENKTGSGRHNPSHRR